ncbi:calcium-binding protein, partial [Pseudomonas sp. AIG]
SGRYQLERVEFADGTLWTREHLSITALQQVGTDGDDVMIGVTSSFAQFISGGAGNDRLTAGSGIDRLEGGSGNDRMDGGAGSDTMIGGAGDDTYVIDNVADIALESLDAGIDTIESSLSFTLQAEFENLLLTGSSSLNGTGNGLDNVMIGNSAANVLIGGGGNDRLDGKGGSDTLQGGIGNDVYVVDRTTDIVLENADEGIDLVESSVTLALGSHVENLTLLGSTAIDGSGNALGNHLKGNSAVNVISGLAGNDVLDGGAGADWLMGGQGSDTYIFGRNYGSDVIIENDPTPGNGDLIQFMEGISQDQLWFRSVDAGQGLEVSVIGTTDKLTIKDWYVASGNRVEQFKTAGGKMLVDAEVQSLVDAMAAFSPPAAGQTSLSTSQHAALDVVIANSWKSEQS